MCTLYFRFTVVLVICCSGSSILMYLIDSASQCPRQMESSDYLRSDHSGHHMAPVTASSNRGSPADHVFYLKTHKTGSTTMMTILAEYCRSHQLLPLLPSLTNNHINVFHPFHTRQIRLIPGVNKYDMVFNHHIFNPGIYSYLHNDTFRFTTIREPFSQFVSSIEYFSQYVNIEYLQRVKGTHKVVTFLSNPEEYEANVTNPYRSFTNNRQSLDLGFDLRYQRNDTGYIRTFIQNLEKHFDVILISDYFDESLVLLKRLLRWKTQDIIYFRKLQATKKHDYIITAEHRKRHRRISVADRALYDHFLPIFKKTISEQQGLMGEVEELQLVLRQVGEFCVDSRGVSGVDSLVDSRGENKQLIIKAGRWTDQVSILRSKCKWLTLREVGFTRYLQKNIDAMVGL